MFSSSWKNDSTIRVVTLLLSIVFIIFVSLIITLLSTASPSSSTSCVTKEGTFCYHHQWWKASSSTPIPVYEEDQTSKKHNLIFGLPNFDPPKPEGDVHFRTTSNFGGAFLWSGTTSNEKHGHYGIMSLASTTATAAWNTTSSSSSNPQSLLRSSSTQQQQQQNDDIRDNHHHHQHHTSEIYQLRSHDVIHTATKRRVVINQEN
jgi:ABC-type transport system involved in multi-copper enzyme maturation permease subunit